VSYPQNPSGAPQPAQPYPPQGGQPYPPQPYPAQQPYPPQQAGQPYPPPGQFGTPPQFGGPAPAAPKKRVAPRLILSLVAILVVAVIAIVGIISSKDDAHNAKVNDCLSGTSAKSLKIVDCTKPHQYKVIGTVKNKTESEYNGQDVCAAYDDADYVYWWGESGKKGDVLCLKSDS
jgi:Septum formation